MGQGQQGGIDCNRQLHWQLRRNDCTRQEAGGHGGRRLQASRAHGAHSRSCITAKSSQGMLRRSMLSSSVQGKQPSRGRIILMRLMHARKPDAVPHATQKHTPKHGDMPRPATAGRTHPRCSWCMHACMHACKPAQCKRGHIPNAKHGQPQLVAPTRGQDHDAVEDELEAVAVRVLFRAMAQSSVSSLRGGNHSGPPQAARLAPSCRTLPCQLPISASWNRVKVRCTSRPWHSAQPRAAAARLAGHSGTAAHLNRAVNDFRVNPE